MSALISSYYYYLSYFLGRLRFKKYRFVLQGIANLHALKKKLRLSLKNIVFLQRDERERKKLK